MLLVALLVGVSLHFVSQHPRACAPQSNVPRYSSRAVVLQQLRGGDADTAALISQLGKAEAALQALERKNDKSPSALETKSKLEQSIRSGVARLRELGMPDDQIMMAMMQGQNSGQPAMSPNPSPSPPAAAATAPISDRPLSNGMTHGVILIRDRDGSVRPFVLIHGLQISDASTGEGTAECVCMLNSPESHKPSGFSIAISINSIREVTKAMFVHVEEDAVLGMLHDATDGVYGCKATERANINLPSYFKERPS